MEHNPSSDQMLMMILSSGHVLYRTILTDLLLNVNSNLINLRESFLCQQFF